jgi:PST family polysaccharide transporter
MGYFHGDKAMGTYAFAYNMADTPTGTLAEHVGDVLTPSFAKLEPADRGRAFVRSAKLMALLVFPLSVGLAAVAPTFIPTLLSFSPKWKDVSLDLTAMLMLLSALSVMRPISMTTTSLLQSQRRPRILMTLGIFKAVTILAIIFVLGRLDPYWVCGAALIAYAIHMLAGLFAARATDQVPVLSVLFSIAPPLLACVPMALAVVGVRALLRSAGVQAGALSLVLEVLTGALVYPVSAFVLAPHATKDIIGVARSVLDRRRGRNSIAP